MFEERAEERDVMEPMHSVAENGVGIHGLPLDVNNVLEQIAPRILVDLGRLLDEKVHIVDVPVALDEMAAEGKVQIVVGMQDCASRIVHGERWRTPSDCLKS